MRALAHPIRSELLQVLMADGPRTASQLSAQVPASPSNCSWHLRHLAQLGLVERADDGSRRDRPWRACQVGLDIGDLATDPVVRASQNAAIATAVNRENSLTTQFLETEDEFEPEWLAAATINTYSLVVTAAELQEITAAVDEIVRPYVRTIRQDRPAGARLVHTGFRALPRGIATGNQ
jgi:DNA-binding transcriptional ArsR family regulator